MNPQLQKLKTWYQQGEIFAYPTEAVYGLGCDPLNKNAVYEILRLKERPVEKGMILIASDFEQVASFVEFEKLSHDVQTKILDSWPGPVTWLLPKSAQAPDWVCGDSDMLAVRISAHPLVQEMCNALNAPMISTSANKAGDEPAKSEEEVRSYFSDSINIMHGELGKQNSPSKIYHSLSLELIRA